MNISTFLSLITLIFLLISCFLLGATVNKIIVNLEERAAMQTKCHALYSDFVHEMWIRNPQFVEQAMAECESFKEIQEIKQGDFEDEFLFWNSQDSIEYYAGGGKYGELPYLYK